MHVTSIQLEVNAYNSSCMDITLLMFQYFAIVEITCQRQLITGVLEGKHSQKFSKIHENLP